MTVAELAQLARDCELNDRTLEILRIVSRDWSTVRPQEPVPYDETVLPFWEHAAIKRVIWCANKANAFLDEVLRGQQ